MAEQSRSPLARIRNSWKNQPPRRRSLISGTLKAVITIGAFYLLFTHKIAVKDEIEVALPQERTVKVLAGEVLTTTDGQQGVLEVGPQIRLETGEKIRLTLGLKDRLTLLAGKFLPVDTSKISKGTDVLLPTGEQGRVRIAHITTISAIRNYLPNIVLSTFLLFAVMATLVKFLGVFGNMYRWHLLLVGQGMRFPAGHIIGTFLIGRFLGTFMPSTIGLDGYRLWDAAHYSKRGIESAAALAIDKVLGFVGIFLTFLIALPFGYKLLGDYAGITVAITVPVAVGIILAFFLALFYPGIIQFFIKMVPLPAKGKIRQYVKRVNHSAAAYKHKKKLLMTCAFFAFFGHFTTAAMYFFTALAVGVVGASFWLVTFGSSIQIFATLISPTMAGEGAREIVQALVLGKHLGHSQAILSAALGFWAAEAMTLSGAFFLWARRGGYKPKFLHLDKMDDVAALSESAPGTDQGARLSRPRRFWIHLKMGLLSGLLAGAALGIVEAVIIVITNSQLPEWWVLPYAPLLYMPIYAAIGAGLGLAGGLLSAIFWGRPTSSRCFAAYWSAIFALFAFVMVRFRIMRDVLLERPFALPLQVLLLLAFVVLFFLARWLWRQLLEKTALRRLTGFGGAFGGLVIMILVAGLVAGGFWLATRSPGAAIPETVPSALRDRPNVILIMVDALRADRLNCYGYGPKTSPGMDALAADAIRFETCISQASWTKPSTATLFTSLYPSSHQAIYKPDMLPDAVVSLAEMMDGEEYFCLGFANNANITPSFNFGQGFDEYIYLEPDYFFMAPESGFQLTGYNQLRLIRERFISQDKNVSHYYQDAQVVNENVISWLDKLHRGRFFLYIHYMETHDPYFVHPYNGVGYARVANPNPDPSMAGLLSETYDGELRYVDQAIAELISWLQEHGLYDQTLIVLTADHGQEFQEHGGWWHGTTLYDEQIHVPLIVKMPGNQMAGTVDGRMVRTLDIAPTISSLAFIPPYSTMQGQSFLGPEGRNWTGQEDVFSEEDHEGNVVQSLRTKTWKLIEANARNPRGLPPLALYHIEEDPGEMNNLAGEREDLVDLMATRLKESQALAQGGAVPRQEREIDEATRERLKALGYVE